MLTLPVGNFTLPVGFNTFIINPESGTADDHENHTCSDDQSLFHPLETPLTGVTLITCCRQTLDATSRCSAFDSSSSDRPSS